MKRFPYYIRLSIIILILLSPIPAFQIGWYLFGKKDGLLVKSKNQNCLPKIMFPNSSAEYWRGDCSLTHIDILGEKDLDLDENIRIYLFSSTQHGAGVLPQSNSTGAAEGAIGLYGFNVVDYAP